MADSKPGVHVVQLKHVSVPPSMLIGEKFIKWDEVSSELLNSLISWNLHFDLFRTHHLLLLLR